MKWESMICPTRCGLLLQTHFEGGRFCVRLGTAVLLRIDPRLLGWRGGLFSSRPTYNQASSCFFGTSWRDMTLVLFVLLPGHTITS